MIGVAQQYFDLGGLVEADLDTLATALLAAGALSRTGPDRRSHRCVEVLGFD